MPILPGYRLIETTVRLIEKQIKDNIADALEEIRLLHADALVTLEPPKEYFIYERSAHVYRAPAVFTIFRNQDFRNDAKNANHLNSMCEGYVAIVVQDRNETNLEIKSWRYQAALTKLVHEVTLTSSDGAVRLFSRVQNCEFSGVINLKNPNASESVFRKEVSLRLQVEHVENLQIS